MIGYYVHHQGRGHVHRAEAFARAWTRRTGEHVTGLSSVAEPADWHGSWRVLPRDDTGQDAGPDPRDPTARGALHWAPLGHAGLRARTAAISRWIEETRPEALVVDVSVEVVLLARLHGVPVVSVVQPGRRDDAAHVTGLRVADALVCPWPAEAEGPLGSDRRMLPGLPSDLDERAVRVGALSRFAPTEQLLRQERRGPLRVAVLEGSGGPGLFAGEARRRLGPPAAGSGPGWVPLGGEATWTREPVVLLAGCDVVVTHAGGGALADVAAARVPAVVVAGERPHDEQRTTAGVLATGHWPVLASPDAASAFDPATLERAAGLDGRRWWGWIEGSGDRFADVVAAVALPSQSSPPSWSFTSAGAGGSA